MRSSIIRIALVCAALNPLGMAHAVYTTQGVFERDPAFLGGVVEGAGTSSVTTGVALTPEGPNALEFTGTAGLGTLPTSAFNAGSVSFFNGAVAQAPLGIRLSISGFDCGTLSCTEQQTGSTQISFVITPNTDDPIASADSMCIDTIGGEQCAWVEEFTSQTFSIIASFGSLIVQDIIPETAGAFVTLGRDPTANVLRAVPVPEPAVEWLFLVGALWLRFRGCRGRRVVVPG